MAALHQHSMHHHVGVALVAPCVQCRTCANRVPGSFTSFWVDQCAASVVHPEMHVECPFYVCISAVYPAKEAVEEQKH
jgi:hypothetical protein